MKNKGIIIAIVAVVLLLAGGFIVMKNNQKIASNPSAGSLAQPDTSKGESVITSIKDALSKSMTLTCEFTDERGRGTKSYVKNGAVRADITSPNANEAGSFIIKDKKMYFWNDKQAMMMEIPAEANTQTKQGGQEQELMNSMEEYKDHCKPGVVADSLFTPPADIKFTDFSKMMIPPSGMPQKGNLKMDQKQAEEMMKKYAPSISP